MAKSRIQILNITSPEFSFVARLKLLNFFNNDCCMYPSPFYDPLTGGNCYLPATCSLFGLSVARAIIQLSSVFASLLSSTLLDTHREI